MSLTMRQEWRSRLLRPRMVHEEVFIQGLAHEEAEMIREALEKGLTPNGFEVVEDTLILRFDRIESRKPFAEGASNGPGDKEIHRKYYLADRDRFLADGGGCETQELGELLCDECYS